MIKIRVSGHKCPEGRVLSSSHQISVEPCGYLGSNKVAKSLEAGSLGAVGSQKMETLIRRSWVCGVGLRISGYISESLAGCRMKMERIVTPNCQLRRK